MTREQVQPVTVFSLVSLLVSRYSPEVAKAHWKIPNCKNISKSLLTTEQRHLCGQTQCHGACRRAATASSESCLWGLDGSKGSASYNVTAWQKNWLSPGGITVFQRNLKPNISCHPGHRKATLDSERMPKALGYLFHLDKSSALRNASFLGKELNRTHGSSMFV